MISVCVLGVREIEFGRIVQVVVVGWSACVLEGPEDQPERVVQGLVLAVLREAVDRDRGGVVLERE